MATYKSYSFFNKTPQDNWSMGYYEDRGMVLDSSDQYIILESRHNNRPDILSNDLYGVPDLWWVIFRMNMNTINDPLRDFKEGVILRCPTKSRIFGGLP